MKNQVPQIVCLRKAELKDADQISHLIQNNFDYAPGYQGLTAEEKQQFKNLNDINSWSKKLNSPSTSIVIQDVSSQILGILFLSQKQFSIDGKQETVGVITRFHVAHTLNKSGLGTLMVDYIENNIPDTIPILGVTASSPAAISFFQKRGYTATGIQNPLSPKSDEFYIKHFNSSCK